jgi:hypothetical protein
MMAAIPEEELINEENFKKVAEEATKKYYYQFLREPCLF